MADIFFDMEETTNNKKTKTPEKTQEKWNPLFLVSSDSFSNCGLDLIFELTKEAGFDWIDLAIWKNFDARNTDYVKKTSKKHDLPIKIIQVSENVNQKELNKALDLCEATGADTININAPKFFNMKAYNFLTENLENYKKENKHINFSIINPEDSNLFALPIPKYRFTNIVEIIKKFWCYLGLDISNFDVEVLENDFTRKLSSFVPYVTTIYFSDKNRVGDWHLIPWEWTLKLDSFLKKVKQIGFHRYFSSKISITKSDLSDYEKLTTILKKIRNYYKEHFEEITMEE